MELPLIEMEKIVGGTSLKWDVRYQEFNFVFFEVEILIRHPSRDASRLFDM